MSRRKDNKGRVLRTGESQRKDLIYQYRYTDALGNRKCIYFQNRRIRVDHQLIRESGGKYYVEKTKTECGRRFIPMTEGVFQACRTCLQIANG